jgi:N utilization substance protein A
MEITDLVNTIEGLTEEQTVEIVAQAEVLAEAQSEELPRRKGPRASAGEPAVVVDGLEDGQLGAVADESADASSGDESLEEGLSDDLADTAAAELETASATERAATIAGEPSPEDAVDSERDEAGDDEIHDVALATEKARYSPQGHEVTFAPSDDDQGESIRIVTEAVEQGGLGGPAPAPPPSAPEPSAPARSPGAPSPNARPNPPSEGSDDEPDEAP